MEQQSSTRLPHLVPEFTAAIIDDDTSTVSAPELQAHLTTPFIPSAAPGTLGPQADVASSLPPIPSGHRDLMDRPPIASGEQPNVPATPPGVAAMPDPLGHILSARPSGSDTAIRKTEPSIDELPSMPTSSEPPPAPLEAQPKPRRPTSLPRKVLHRFAHLAYLTETCIDEGPPSVRAVFSAAEVVTGIHRVYIAFGLVLSLSIYMVIGSSAPLVCNLICSVIPACSSIRAIEYSTKEEDTKWLMYWAVFACFSITDHFSGKIPPYFPFYWLIKTTFLACCFFPVRRNGSWFLYYRVVRRHILRHRDSIDKSSISPSETARSLSADKMPEPWEGSGQYRHVVL